MSTNINRYKPDNDGRLWPASDGEYVLYADHVAALALMPGETQQLKWFDGAPPHPWDKEWFIAQTTYGDKVVLTALPEEFTYDYKTADDTYIKRDKIRRWMQFPDSAYVEYAPAEPGASPAPLPVAVKVKPLGWVSIGEVIFASTPFGSYEIRPNRTSSTTYPLELVVPGEKTATRFFYFEDKAKAAAQADYETRIRSALSSPASPQCCMCGKKGLSTVEGDGGFECELSDGRWVCSAECWDKAVDPAPASDIAALREENERLKKALEKIASTPAWGCPERWETTPAEVRQLARSVLNESKKGAEQ